jgi:hypothetical protein
MIGECDECGDSGAVTECPNCDGDYCAECLADHECEGVLEGED